MCLLYQIDGGLEGAAGGLYLAYDSSTALGANQGSKTAVGGHLGGMALGAAFWLYERRRFAGRRGRW
jgi:hypothetical protein